jgi:ADP-ribose pyrophosphatase YjhB (NUDIX family)
MPSDDPVLAGQHWIPQHEYELILSRVPILCVDLIPLSTDEPAKVGLINRDTYDGGAGWCLVGGAVIRDESLTDAVTRHLQATLGADISLEADSLRLLSVVQYFTDPALGKMHDPRKHAVSLTYTGRCAGQAQVRTSGEAHDFDWFSREELPGLPYGFGQGQLVEAYLRQDQHNDNCQPELF